MNSTLLDRHLHGYFYAVETGQSDDARMRLLRLAREAQTVDEPRLTDRQATDAKLIRLLLATPHRQMSCKKLAAVAHVRPWAVSEAIQRGVLVHHNDRIVSWARLPGVDYSALDSDCKAARFGRVVAAHNKETQHQSAGAVAVVATDG